MATIDIYNLSGKKVGTLALADEVFGAVNEDLLWEAVKHYRAAQRAGTHATKNRWRVSGSGKKLWKQKGAGRGRICSAPCAPAAQCMGRSPALTITLSRARSCWARCVRRWRPSLPTAS